MLVGVVLGWFFLFGLVWFVGVFFFDNLREKRLVPLNSQVLHVLKILVVHQLEITGVGYWGLPLFCTLGRLEPCKRNPEVQAQGIAISGS